MSLYDSLLEKLEGRPYDNYFSAWCPFDEHKSQALLVYEDGRFWCLSCQKSGTHEYLDKFIGSHYRLTQRQPSKPQLLPRWRAWEREHGDVEGIANYAHKSLLKFPQFQSYFKKRKIDEFIDIGYFGFIDGWVLFPVRNPNNKVIDIIVRSTRQKTTSRYVLISGNSGHTRSLYSPDWSKVIKSDEIYVPFGTIDVWSFESLGLPAVTGCTGKSIPVELLKSLNKKIILVPDYDEERDARIIANKVGWRASIKILKYPIDCKDTNDIRMKFNDDKLKEILL